MPYFRCCRAAGRRRAVRFVETQFSDAGGISSATAFVDRGLIDVDLLPPPPPPPAAKGRARARVMRCVVISDTHGKHEYLNTLLPDPAGSGSECDYVLLHCGDVLLQDRAYDARSSVARDSITLLRAFNEWLGTTPVLKRYKSRIVIGGNHDQLLATLGAVEAQRILTHATYLDSRAVFLPATAGAAPVAASDGSGSGGGGSATLDSKSDGGASAGVIVLGLPHSRRGGSDNAAFQFHSHEQPHSFRAITTNTAKADTNTNANGHASDSKADAAFYGLVDVVLTHDQPRGYHGSNSGCRALRAVIQTLRPSFHCWGHVHEYWGVDCQPNKTVGINASTCDGLYRPLHPPIVFDVPIRERSAQDLAALERLNQRIAAPQLS